MSEVIVIGGGPAGMFAALFAARNGHKVTLIEKNEKLGKKLYITGKGRCNITNAGDMEDLFDHVVSNPKFLYSAFYSFDNQMVISFFEEHGLSTKVERGNRVFPVSDHSSDVIAALQRALLSQKVEILLYTKVERLLVEEECIKGVVLSNKKELYADAVIVATGGLSYPTTGSTGDGYRFAEESGHRIKNTTPSLVPFEVKENWCRDLQGLSLKNIRIAIKKEKKTVYDDFGEMLFTHFGVSGPVILSASAAIRPEEIEKGLSLFIDLKPALDEDTLDKRVLKDFEEAKNKQFKNAVSHLFPTKLIPVMIELSGIDPDKKVNEIAKEERKAFVHLMKNLELTITGTRGFKEAIITKGGVSVKDVNPSTMESKRLHGLYFCGEVLDLDAYTGGYNLQIAWSTGYLAGISVK